METPAIHNRRKIKMTILQELDSKEARTDEHGDGRAKTTWTNSWNEHRR